MSVLILGMIVSWSFLRASVVLMEAAMSSPRDSSRVEMRLLRFLVLVRRLL